MTLGQFLYIWFLLSLVVIIAQFVLLLSLWWHLSRQARRAWWYRWHWFVWPEICHWLACGTCRAALFRRGLGLLWPKRRIPGTESVGRSHHGGEEVHLGWIASYENLVRAELGAEIDLLWSQPTPVMVI
jgi:hypothetical protein